MTREEIPVKTESDSLLEKKMDSKSTTEDSSIGMITDKSDETTVSKRQLLISILVIVGVAISFVCASQFSQYTLVVDPTTFNAPYFMLWFNTTWMVLCFPVYLIYNRIRRVTVKQSFCDSSSVYGGSIARGFGRVLLFTVLWSVSNYTFTVALTVISASVATSISSCNAACVWILAMVLLGDKFSIPKLLAVFFAIGGVVLISLDGQLNAPWLGILMAVISAITAALYKTLFKWFLGDATLGEVSLFLSSLGLLNFVLNAIPAVLLNVFHVEFMDLSKLPWLPLIGSAALGLLLNFLINFGIALLHPLVIAVGMLCGLPLNTVVDIVLSQVTVTVMFICGSAAVILSFILVVFPFAMFPFCRKIHMT